MHAREPSLTGGLCPAQGPGAAACPSPLSALCPKQATGGGSKAPPPMQIAGWGSGVGSSRPALHSPCPLEAVASAASGLRDHLKPWRAEPWLLCCQDMVAFAMSLLGDRAALMEGCPVGARGEWS